VSLNANALTTLTRLQALGLTSSDSRLEEEINLVSELVEDYLGYSLAYSEDEVSLQGSGGSDLLLPRAPVIAVSSLSLSEVDLIEADGDFSFPNNYRSLGKIFRSAGWPVYANVRDATGDLDLATVAYPIEITYTAGYWLPNENQGAIPSGVLPLPERIKKAVDLIVYQNLSQEESGASPVGTQNVKKEKTAGGYEVEFVTESKPKQATDWETIFPSRSIFYLSKYVRKDTMVL
jgi:hypothetical protein